MAQRARRWEAPELPAMDWKLVADARSRDRAQPNGWALGSCAKAQREEEEEQRTEEQAARDARDDLGAREARNCCAGFQRAGAGEGQKAELWNPPD